LTHTSKIGLKQHWPGPKRNSGLTTVVDNDADQAELVASAVNALTTSGGA